MRIGESFALQQLYGHFQCGHMITQTQRYKTMRRIDGRQEFLQRFQANWLGGIAKVIILLLTPQQILLLRWILGLQAVLPRSGHMKASLVLQRQSQCTTQTESSKLQRWLGHSRGLAAAEEKEYGNMRYGYQEGFADYLRIWLGR